MTVHPEIRQFLDLIAALDRPPLSALSPQEARATVSADSANLPPGPPVDAVEDLRIPVRDGEIGARRYAPEGADAIIVWMHGGGWVVCDLETHDAMCRLLANAARATVVSVDYRLAPEHPFPGPVDDCWDALSWIAAQHPHVPLVVGGDSAGGDLAAVMALRARDAGGPAIARQILVYPVTDLSTRHPSYAECGDDPDSFLSADDMTWFASHFLSDPAQASDPEASPLLAPDLSNLPPASVVIADHDPLRDEGLAYAERLEAAGVPVTMHRYPDAMHAFFAFASVLERGREAIDAVAADVRSTVGLLPNT
ncbi:MAG TPA: alpha/beta hydrolase [Capillimicrobium sp.]|nr:alpha/beta hydrolase [Capillimicrobium sp.]